MELNVVNGGALAGLHPIPAGMGSRVADIKCARALVCGPAARRPVIVARAGAHRVYSLAQRSHVLPVSVLAC